MVFILLIKVDEDVEDRESLRQLVLSIVIFQFTSIYLLFFWGEIL